jgi:hypothetical protein
MPIEKVGSCNLGTWSSGMILVSGAGGHGFDSRSAPSLLPDPYGHTAASDSPSALSRGVSILSGRIASQNGIFICFTYDL